MRAEIHFSNNYGASIVTGDCFYTSDEKPYELAVMYKGNITYDTPITDDVCGWLNENDVNKLLSQIEALPPKGV